MYNLVNGNINSIKKSFSRQTKIFYIQNIHIQNRETIFFFLRLLRLNATMKPLRDFCCQILILNLCINIAIIIIANENQFYVLYFKILIHFYFTNFGQVFA